MVKLLSLVEGSHLSGGSGNWPWCHLNNSPLKKPMGGVCFGKERRPWCRTERGEHLGFPWRSWYTWLGRGVSGHLIPLIPTKKWKSWLSQPWNEGNCGFSVSQTSSGFDWVSYQGNHLCDTNLSLGSFSSTNHVSAALKLKLYPEASRRRESMFQEELEISVSRGLSIPDWRFYLSLMTTYSCQLS